MREVRTSTASGPQQQLCGGEVQSKSISHTVIRDSVSTASCSPEEGKFECRKETKMVDRDGQER